MSLLREISSMKKAQLETPPARIDSIVRDADQGAFDQWVKALPLADPLRSADLLAEAAEALRNSQCELGHWWARIQRLREVLAHLCPILASRVSATGFPLHGTGREAARRTNAVHREFAANFQLLFEAMVLGGDGAYPRQQKAMAAHRAMSHLATLLRQSALVYRPLAQEHWSQMHAIHHLARSQKLTKLCIDDPLDPTAPRTVGRSYRRVLLFERANTGQFAPAQIDLLFRKLGTWAGLTTLTRASADEPQGGARRWDLELRPLVQRIEQRLADSAAAPAVPARGRITRDMLQRLGQSWANRSNRRFHRIAMGDERDAIVGFEAIVQRLSAPGEADRIGGAPEGSLSLIPLESAGKRARDYQVDRDGNYCWAEVGVDEIVLDEGWVHFSPTADAPVRLRTVDGSRGGYCLGWPETARSTAMVGQILGIADPALPGKLGVGAIRWLREEAGKGLLLGFECLSRGIDQVVRARKAHNGGTAICLYGAYGLDRSEPPVLICPLGFAAHGEQLMLESATGSRIVQIESLHQAASASAFQVQDVSG